MLVMLAFTGCNDSSGTGQNSKNQSALIQPDEHGVFHVFPGENIQRAIDAAAGSSSSKVVRVHAGTYYPEQTSFALLHLTADHDGIVLEADGEVVLSGTHPGSDGQTGTTDDVKVNHVVYFGDGISSQTVLRGFRITGAQPGIIFDASEPSLEPRSRQRELQPGLFFYLDGGAIKIFGRSSPRIMNSIIDENESGLCGGGVSIEHRGLHDQPVQFTSCVFRNNRCPATGSAVDLLEGSSAIFENCLFVNNIGNYGMDRIQRKYGLSYNAQHGSGALTVFPNSRAEVTRCTFSGNWNGVDDHGRDSVYRSTIFWKNDAADGSRSGAPYEIDIIDASGLRDCWIGGGVSDLRGTIDRSQNRVAAPDPEFDDEFRPQRQGLDGLGYRPQSRTDGR
jgi:hypothetical protein